VAYSAFEHVWNYCLGSFLHPEYVPAVGEQLTVSEAVQAVFGSVCCSDKCRVFENLMVVFACDFLRFVSMWKSTT